MDSPQNPPVCPVCGRPMTLARQPAGKLPRTLRCLDCDRHDPQDRWFTVTVLCVGILTVALVAAALFLH